MGGGAPLDFSGRFLGRCIHLYLSTYGANGNAITRNGSAITWSSYNYPTSVSTASESVDFYYGGDRQRWKEVYTNANGTETTYHAGKLFEVAYYLDGGTVLAHYRHYAGKAGLAFTLLEIQILQRLAPDSQSRSARCNLA
jgi:hypothetical protein